MQARRPFRGSYTRKRARLAPPASRDGLAEALPETYPSDRWTEGLTALRIGIDGCNLAMPHGTGVAAYGQVLAETLATGGHAVEGIFRIGSSVPVVREVGMRIIIRATIPFLSLWADAVEEAALDRAFPTTRRILAGDAAGSDDVT